MVNVRAATPADAASIAAIYAWYVDETAISFEDTAPAPDQILIRMSALPSLPWLVAEDAAEDAAAVVGFAYASAHRARAAYRWSVDVSVYLADGQTGLGIGRLLYERLLAELRALGYAAAFAGIALPNPASVGLHESLGFVPVGVYRDVGFKFGAWRDVGWWQLQLIDPLPEVPSEPRGWRSV